MKTNFPSDEILIEFARSGNSVKVTAIDPVSYVEASIIGPANVGEEMLKRNAVRKLAYVMSKQSGSRATR